MIKLIEKLDAKQWFMFLLLAIFLTDLTILLDVPFLRVFFGFLCFTIIPGLLILHILKLKLEILKRLLLAVGLSVAFSMFFGLFINTLYSAFGFLTPLSTTSLVVSFTIILIVLTFVAYKRTKCDFDAKEVFNFNLNIEKDQLISPLIFPILFPFLSIFGRFYMDLTGNNIFLLVLLFSIPAYIAVVTYLNKRIPKATYPIAILMISLALIFMHSLNSNYIMGDDVESEFRAFQIVANNLFWSMSNFRHVLTACLSTSLLPAIFQSLLGINPHYVYKLIYQLIFSITPLVAYFIFKEQVDDRYAFLASFFIMAQYAFIYAMQNAMRMEMAILFFALAMLVFFDNKIDNLSKKVLFLVFMIATVVSHYTVCYLFFILLVLFWMVTALKSVSFKNKCVTGATVALFFAFIFFWYSQVTAKTFSSTAVFVTDTFSNLADFFVEESRQEAARMIYGSGALQRSATKIPDTITVYIHRMSFVLIAIGTLSLFFNLVRNKIKNTKIEKGYILMLLFCFGACAAAVLLPHLSNNLGIERVYFQALFILAPAFVIGGMTIAKLIRLPRLGLLIVVAVLILQFFAGTYMVYQFCGVPHSEDLNTCGPRYSYNYVHDQEVIASKWLNIHGSKLKIYSDYYAYKRLPFGYDVGIYPSISPYFYRDNKTISNGYIYLWHTNLIEGKVYRDSSYYHAKDIAGYSHLFAGKNKIYNNKVSEVWA
jgi:uncharacterized membrane protein